MRRHRSEALAFLVLVAALTMAACGDSGTATSTTVGGGSATPTAKSTGGGSGSQTTSSGGSVQAACGLVSADQLTATLGGPAKPGVARGPITGTDFTFTGCTVDSVASCPATPRSPCPDVYQADWTVRNFPSEAAANARLAHDRRAGPPSTDGGISGATTSYSITITSTSTSGFAEAVRGSTLVSVDLHRGLFDNDVSTTGHFPASATPQLIALTTILVANLGA